MAGVGLVPQAIVLALGAGALGGPEALRLLLQFAGRSAAVDLAICVAAISFVTAPLLGTILLARFVRKPSSAAGGGGAPATDLFAQVTATVSVGAAVLVSACLLLVVGPGSAVRFPVDFAVKNPVVVTVLVVVCAGSLPCAVPLLRFFRGAGSISAGGGRPAAPAAAPATTTTIKLLAAVSLAAASAQILIFLESHWRRRMATLHVVVVATITVAGTMLLVRCCSRRARNAAAGARGGAPART